MRSSILWSVRADLPTHLSSPLPPLSLFLSLSVMVYCIYCTSRINWPQTPRSRRVGYLESNAVSPEALVSKRSGEALLNWFKTSSRRQALLRRSHCRDDVSFSQLQNRKCRPRRDAMPARKKVDSSAKRSTASYVDCDLNRVLLPSSAIRIKKNLYHLTEWLPISAVYLLFSKRIVRDLFRAFNICWIVEIILEYLFFIIIYYYLLYYFCDMASLRLI